MDSGADAFHELVEWCLMDVQMAYNQRRIADREAGMLQERLLQLRACIDTLYDYTDQPIHFFYIHFLCLLSTFYLPLFAIDSAYSAGAGAGVHWTLDVVCGLIVVLQAIFVVGLRVLGQKMVDPYGDDLEDLSVIQYVKAAWRTSNRILAAQCPGEVSSDMEMELAQQHESLGFAWELPRMKPTESASQPATSSSITSRRDGIV